MMDSINCYSVVHFIDDNTVEGVPKSWIKEDGTCAWPSNHGVNVRKMIEQKVKPNDNEFNFYNIRELSSNISMLNFLILYSRMYLKFR